MSEELLIAENKLNSVTGLINKGIVDLLQNFDPMYKNRFELLIYKRKILGTTLSEALSSSTAGLVASGSLDTTLAKLHLHEITLPSVNISYEELNEIKFVKDIEYPSEVTMTFFENSAGFVLNYMNALQEESFSRKLNSNVGGSTKYGIVFQDDQESIIRDAIVYPLNGNNLPTGAWFILKGLRYKSRGDITFSNEDGEPMLIEIVFSIEDIVLGSALQKIKALI